MNYIVSYETPYEVKISSFYSLYEAAHTIKLILKNAEWPRLHAYDNDITLEEFSRISNKDKLNGASFCVFKYHGRIEARGDKLGKNSFVVDMYKQFLEIEKLNHDRVFISANITAIQQKIEGLCELTVLSSKDIL